MKQNPRIVVIRPSFCKYIMFVCLLCIMQPLPVLYLQPFLSLGTIKYTRLPYKQHKKKKLGGCGQFHYHHCQMIWKHPRVSPYFAILLAGSSHPLAMRVNITTGLDITPKLSPLVKNNTTLPALKYKHALFLCMFPLLFRSCSS